MVKLSIVVPVYNAQDRLKKCIESILAQSFKDFELILVDDGSKDNSGNICDEYAKKDSRVVVLHQENSGAYNARIAGIKKSQGEFLGFCDSDDYIDSNMYEVLFSMQSMHDADIASCAVLQEAGENKSIIGSGKPSGYYDGLAMEKLKNELFCMPPRYRIAMTSNLYSYIFRRELLLENDYISDLKLSLAEDTICSFSAILKAKSIIINNEFTPYHYIDAENSIMHSYTPKAFSQAEYVYEYFKNFLIKHNRENLIPSLDYFILRLYEMIMDWTDPAGNIFKVSKEFSNGIYDAKILRLRLENCKNIKGKERFILFLISRKMFFSYFAIKRFRENIRKICKKI